jgi:AraC family transcriptional regulator
MLDPLLLHQIATETECRNADRIELMPLLPGNDPQIEFIASAFHREMQCGGMGGQLYAESLANVLVIHLLRNYSIASPQLDDGETRLSQVQLQQILDYVQSYLDKSIGLNELANLLGMNVHSFWKLFKRSTGMPPHQYVIRCRLARAQILTKFKLSRLAQVLTNYK